MNKLKFLIIIGIGTIAGACSSAPTTNTANTPATANSNTAVVTNANTNAAKPAADHDDETPAAVKAVFPDAQSFTAHHKTLTDAQVAEIEKASGGKVAERDFHSYLAFTTAGGTRRQLGAATVVKAGGRDVVIVYESKGGMPTIKEIRADGVPKEFLAQFAGKGHDDKLILGTDLKANGADEATAKAISDAVRIDAAVMQALYGAAHTH